MNKMFPIFNKEKAVVLITNNSNAVFCGVFILNIIDKIPDRCFDKIVIIYDDLTSESKFSLQKLSHKICFYRYSFDDFINEHQLNFLKPTDLEKKQYSGLRRYSHLSFIKYKIFDFLNYFSNVVFFDTDMLILTDVSELFSVNGIYWRKSLKNLSSSVHDIGVNFFEHMPEFLNVPGDVFSLNEGLIAVSDDINYNDAYISARQFIQNIGKNTITVGVDGLAFIYPVLKGIIKPHLLDETVYNVAALKNCNANTKILHFQAAQKVWSNQIVYNYFGRIWDNYYTKFLKITNIVNTLNLSSLDTFSELYNNTYISYYLFSIFSKLNKRSDKFDFYINNRTPSFNLFTRNKSFIKTMILPYEHKVRCWLGHEKNDVDLLSIAKIIDIKYNENNKYVIRLKKLDKDGFVKNFDNFLDIII